MRIPVVGKTDTSQPYAHPDNARGIRKLVQVQDYEKDEEKDLLPVVCQVADLGTFNAGVRLEGKDTQAHANRFRSTFQRRFSAFKGLCVACALYGQE